DAPAADPSWLTAFDAHLFNEGNHRELYRKLGAHRETVNGKEGTRFAVWAPNAREVSVVGEFNGWEPGKHRLDAQGESGIWQGFIEGVGEHALYKFHIASHKDGYTVAKSDPFAFAAECAPKTASVVKTLDYDWGDGDWMAKRHERNNHAAPMSIYEMHLGSWKHHNDGTSRSLSYRELADVLPKYLHEHGFTHVEFMPLMEHPLYKSWGYQVTGYFAPTSRFGDPQDLMYLIDKLHQAGIGVILDWVPSHFPTDEHGLSFFDGTHLFEHADPKEGFHPDWTSAIFNYGRYEVQSFLISSAMFWLDKYHADGLRVDGVASMLYRDYSRKEGEWVPNIYGGNENLEAIELLQKLNVAVYEKFPDTQMIAEESTAWPGVSKPTWAGGLGFGFKWDMGWMHDTLEYLGRDPIHRKHHHNEISFRGLYQFTENYVLPLSHDEVVHGKGSLLDRFPGDEWQKFATLRLLFANQWANPGKKMLFMGSEFGQTSEWKQDEQLPWWLLDHAPHQGAARLVAELNLVYKGEPALAQLDCDPRGFEW
ncbi:MAG: 1,4-alpha-glucan branching protein GlgB, partial [Myxococcota bacterium]